MSSTSTDTNSVPTDSENDASNTETKSSIIPPWNNPNLTEVIEKKKRKDNARFRQHVNPLARQYQLPTQLPPGWPTSAFTDPSLPLHLDIGCSKGGYLLDLAAATASTADPENGTSSCSPRMNYLGLEIRPAVAAYAAQRISRHPHAVGRVDFLGCNANVDLERIIRTYTTNASLLQRVTIQFPDPHFKTQHQKRRVVSADLVRTLAKLMPTEGQVFLQSDVQGTRTRRVLVRTAAISCSLDS